MGLFKQIRIGFRYLGGVAALSVGLAVAGVYAQTVPPSRTMLVEPPAPLLPATLGEFERVSQGDVGDGLDAIDPAEKPVLTEDGIRRFARSDYTRGTSRENIAVYQFMDASGAISAYDYFRRLGMRPVKLGDSAVSGDDVLLIRSGINVVRETGKLSRGTASAVSSFLIDRLPKARGTAGIDPLLPTLLPAKGLDHDSVKYALGPVAYQAMGGVLPPQAVGFDKNAETVTAKYRNGGTLTLVIYPTPQIAGADGRAIEDATKQGPHITMRREGTLLAIATGPWPAGEAQTMVNNVHLRSEVTFDKPMPLDFHTEVGKTYTLLQSIAIFCVLGAVAAVVLGLFFGGGRALIRVLQGKPAATEPEFLRIDLRGASVPSRDPSGKESS